jgi:N-acetylglutamate synthase-like GNAT family acetyltransferase
LIEYRTTKPTIKEFKALFESSGWTSSIKISNAILKNAMEQSWYWVSAYDNGKVVGIGRLISDGALYALVSDLMIFPEYQGQGVGKTLLKMLKDKCLESGIQRVWLFAGPGKVGFYEKNGFEIRSLDTPGMQLKMP